RDLLIRALDLGADDYVTKPAEAAVIRARVRALVRRGQQDTARSIDDAPLRVGNVSFDQATRRIHVEGRILNLTPKEASLLQQLMLHPGVLIPRSDLLEKVWDMHFDPGSNVVDTHISRLRTKLRDGGAEVTLRGVRGTGFILAPDSGGSA